MSMLIKTSSFEHCKNSKKRIAKTWEEVTDFSIISSKIVANVEIHPINCFETLNLTLLSLLLY